MASDLCKQEAGYTAGTPGIDQRYMMLWARREPDPEGTDVWRTDCGGYQRSGTSLSGPYGSVKRCPGDALRAGMAPEAGRLATPLQEQGFACKLTGIRDERKASSGRQPPRNAGGRPAGGHSEPATGTHRSRDSARRRIWPPASGWVRGGKCWTTRSRSSRQCSSARCQVPRLRSSGRLLSGRCHRS